MAGIDDLIALAQTAGTVVMRHYGCAGARLKSDSSPVTVADEAAEAVIVEGLRRLWPDIPVVAEEMVSGGRQPRETGERFWLVDPLDGTKEFLSGNGEFTVNIALVENGRPTLAVVGAPARDLLYASDGRTAYRRNSHGRQVAIHTRRPPGHGMTAATSRSHRDRDSEAFLDTHRVADVIVAGSSLKFCLLAEGKADVYPRFGRTMEWDTAAGHAILRAAGGIVVGTDGAELAYGKSGFVNPSFVAWGREAP